MTADQPRQGSNFVWCLRHFAWVILLCGLVGAAAAMFISPSKPTYQTSALVVAKQLTVNQTVLPTLAESLFADAAVTAKLAADPAVHGDTTGLIPDRLSVVPETDSIVLDVQARDPNPATAVRLANLAANALVDELNKGGAGVGTFAVQSPAPLPATPLREFSQLVRGALGALAGLLVGLGIVALIGVIRRPVVTSRDVEGTLNLPLLGTVELQRLTRGGYIGPRGVRGIAAVTRSLATLPAGRLVLISPRSATGMRRRLYVMLAVALSTLRKVGFEASDELVAAVRANSIEHRDPGAPAGRGVPGVPGAPGQQPEQEAGDLVLVDGGSPLDNLAPASRELSVVAVAVRGTSRRRLRYLASEYLDGGLVGIVLVQRRVGLGRRSRSLRSVPAARTTSAPVSGPATAPEPERA